MLRRYWSERPKDSGKSEDEAEPETKEDEMADKVDEEFVELVTEGDLAMESLKNDGIRILVGIATECRRAAKAAEVASSSAANVVSMLAPKPVPEGAYPADIPAADVAALLRLTELGMAGFSREGARSATIERFLDTRDASHQRVLRLLIDSLPAISAVCTLWREGLDSPQNTLELARAVQSLVRLLGGAPLENG